MRPARLIRNRVIGIARRLRAQLDRLRPRRKPTLEFEEVRRRLELVLNAMFNQPLGDGLLARLPGAQPNVRSIVLPPSVPETDDALERYRLLAIEQGARVARGTREMSPADPIERDLYMIIEGAAIDADIAERAPRLAEAMARMRRQELARRPQLQWIGGVARPVETLLQSVLAADPGAPLPGVPRTATPGESAIAARELSAELRRGMKGRRTYHPIDTVALWDDDSASGRQSYLPGFSHSQLDLPFAKSSGSGKDADETRGKPDRSSDDGQRDDSADVHENAPADPEADGAERREAPPDATTASDEAEPTQGGAGSSEDTAGARAERHAEERDVDAPPPKVAPAPGGIPYPEWVDRFKRLEPRYATVFASDAPEGDGEWARAALRDHGPIVRQLRDRFSLLRARRLRLRAQRSGDELDLDACVNALIDLHLRRVPSDRLYQTGRNNRHSLAITILADVSGSTREELPNGQRVIDVERLSVILASEALASLGDPYSILVFSGNSRHNVQVATVKAFSERDLGAMHRRVSALEPGDNTRLGAAIRHATATLVAQQAHRHVLLILSDGRPNDLDWYWGAAAVEDSRVALLEARAAGVHSFCVTVDSKEADYLPHLFGEGRYWVLANPADLPKALIRLIDTIITG